MASIRRKPDTRFWFACFTDHTGMQRQRSTKTTSAKDARAIAESFEEAYNRKQTESQMRRVMSDISKEIHGAPLNDVTLRQYADSWLARIKPEVSQSTHVRYTGAVNTLKILAPEVTAKRIDLVTTADLVALRDAMLKGRSRSTTKTNMKPVGHIFKSAWADGLISENPATRLRPLRRDDTAPGERKRPFTLEEIAAIMHKADDEWRGMILAGYHTAGQRLGDIAALTPSDVDLKAGIVAFRTGKTERAVVLPIAKEWLSDLRERVNGKKPHEPLFPRAAAKVKAGKGNVGKVSNSFRTLLSKAKLASPPGTTVGKVKGRRAVSPLSFHSFRHTATSLMKNAGVSDAVAMDIVGHDSEAVSDNYTHIDQETKRAALNKLPGIGG